MIIKSKFFAAFALILCQCQAISIGPFNIPIPKEIGEGFGDIGKGLFSTVSDVGNGLGGGLLNVGKGVGGTLGGVTTGLTDTVTGLGSGVANILGGVTDGLAETVTGKPVGLLKGLGGGLAGGVFNIGKGVAGLLKGTGTGLFNGVTGVGTGVGSIAGGLGEGVVEGGAAIGEGVGDVAEGVKYASYAGGNSLLSGIIDPILKQCANLKNLLGITYDKMRLSDKAPNFDDLEIDYLSGTFNESFSINTVADDIVNSKFYKVSYDASEKLYIFIHGWNTDPSQKSYQQIKNALFADGKNNVLALNSSKYLKNLMYLDSSTYVVFIGNKIAQVIINLYQKGFLIENIHLIGHSLGAHISGFAGKVFRNATGVSLSHITGLDTAGPCFAEMKPEYHLSSTDAVFVDAIHTNANFLGMAKPVGHLDFYPNGGRSQKGCLSLTCDHGRAVSYYAESITNPKGFLAAKCESWDQFTRGECGDNELIYMGFEASPNSQNGTYYLRTTASAPFALGEEGLNKE